MNVPWQAAFCTADAAHCDAVAWLPRLVDWAEHSRPECDNRTAAAVKCVAAQAVQVASALAEPAVKYSPAGHVVFLAAQVVKSLSPTLKSVAAHGVHVASVAAVAEAAKYSPAGQVVVLAAQDVAALSPTLKSVDAQAEHVASALGEPAVKYVPAAHDAVRVWHGP